MYILINIIVYIYILITQHILLTEYVIPNILIWQRNDNDKIKNIYKNLFLSHFQSMRLNDTTRWRSS